MPTWLDEFQDDEVGEIPEDALSDLSEAARSQIAEALKENPDLLDKLAEHRLIRISEILEGVLDPLTEPLKLTLRDVKSLTNQLWIHLRIESYDEIGDAKVAAAYLLADRLDPIWLDQYMGQTVSERANKKGRINQAAPETKSAFKKMITKKKVDRLGLRRWRASA